MTEIEHVPTDPTALRECPDCQSVTNSSANGGTDYCFHCGECEFIECAFNTECEQGEDGRWIAEEMDTPGALVYGDTQQEAQRALHGLLADIRKTK